MIKKRTGRIHSVGMNTVIETKDSCRETLNFSRDYLRDSDHHGVNDDQSTKGSKVSFSSTKKKELIEKACLTVYDRKSAARG